MPEPTSTTYASPTVPEYLDYLEQATVYFWDEYGSFSAEPERHNSPTRPAACSTPSVRRRPRRR
jgi:hypothetical protein